MKLQGVVVGVVVGRVDIDMPSTHSALTGGTSKRMLATLTAAWGRGSLGSAQGGHL